MYPFLKTIGKKILKKVFEQCEGSLLYPMFIKPANIWVQVLGSQKLKIGKNCKMHFKKPTVMIHGAIVEQGIEAREIEVAVLGNEDVRTTMPGEIVKDVAFYDYNSKYLDNKIEMQIPAQIPEETQAKAQEFAQKLIRCLGGGPQPLRLFLTNKNELFLNELNDAWFYRV